MIQIVVQDGIRDIPDRLERFRRSISLVELAGEIQVVIEDDNRAARLAGVGADGQPLAPLAESTVEKRRGDPGAPPLIPHYDASRAIGDFTVDVAKLAEAAFEITGGWPNFDELQFHLGGYTHRSGTQVPARDIGGIRPQTMLRIMDLFDGWCESVADSL